jgi:hypothetical protein
MPRDDTEAEAPDTSDDELLRSTRQMKFGQYRFIGFLVAFCVLLMVLSPIFNRYLEAYQAVVVFPPENGRVRVLTHDGMPRTKRVSADLAARLEVGTYLRKDNLAWDPVPIPREELSRDPRVDDPARQPPRLLPDLFARYTAEWAGTVVELTHRRLPSREGRPGEQPVETRMVVELEDGTTHEMVVPDALLRDVAEGVRIEKDAGAWEPVIVRH